MKKFEVPEMNISMFDAESVVMLSGTQKAIDELTNTQGVSADNIMVADWNVTV